MSAPHRPQSEGPAGPGSPLRAGAPPSAPPAAGAAYTLLDDMALTDAAEAAAQARAAEGGAPLSAAEVGAARAKAQDLLRSGAAAGLRDMRNLALALGLPAARLSLKHLVEFGAAPAPVQRALCAAIDAVSEITEHGCQEVAFFNKQKGRADRAFLLLDECPADHDLTAQLDRLAPHIPVERRPEITKHLTALVYFGRSAFAKVCEENPQLVRDILKYLPAADRVDISKLHVDPRNTTLCVHPRAPRRVGIFVRMMADDLGPGGAPAGAAPPRPPELAP